MFCTGRPELLRWVGVSRGFRARRPDAGGRRWEWWRLC